MKSEVDQSSVLVQYVLVRKDLNWPTGAIIAQACHASTSALWISRDHSETQVYLGDIDNMHKVVLGADSEESVRETASALEAAGIEHKLWIEQPDNIVTALATRPAKRSILKPIFKAYKLLK